MQLNGQDISNIFGIKIIATKGLFDLPGRKGEAYYSFEDETGVDPFVDNEDLKHGANEIQLDCFCQGDSQNEVINNILSFKEELNKEGLHELSVYNQIYLVYREKKSEVVMIKGNVAKFRVILKMTNSDKSVSKVYLVDSDGNYLIDDNESRIYAFSYKQEEKAYLKDGNGDYLIDTEGRKLFIIQ